MKRLPLRWLLVAALAAPGAVVAQNIAVVNGRPLPKALEDAWMQQLRQQGQRDTPQLRQMLRQDLIRREVLLQEALRRGVDARPDVQFQVEVQRQATLIQALVREEMDKRPITDDEVAAVYARQTQQAPGREYLARHILVETEAQARQILAELQRGARFEDLARQSRDSGSAANGGALGWSAPNAYVEPFARALALLGKGQLTAAPVQTSFGWHVIRVDDVREGQIPPLAQAQAAIRDALRQQRVQAFTDELRRSASVTE